jgi:hypothetical protein
LVRIGALLEDLGSRFELVVEAVSGFGGRLDRLKEDILSQFSEVGKQIRFLSDQISENRASLTALRSDFGAEMIRLGETLGRTRVEFREQLASAEANLNQVIAAQAAETRAGLEREAAERTASLRQWAETGGGRQEAELRRGARASGVGREMAATMRELKHEIATSAESTAKKLGAELKQTSKTLAAVARKLERFDDRVTIQIRDQDQRLKKIETRGRR